MPIQSISKASAKSLVSMPFLSPSRLSLSLSKNMNTIIHISQRAFPFINKKQKHSRRPVTSFARFHISVCKALAIAQRKGESSVHVNPFTSIGHGGYVRRMHNRYRGSPRFSLTARARLRNRGVTPGDFNERIGALLARCFG